MIGLREVASECAGTALLLFGGLSAVAFSLSENSPLGSLFPNEIMRRLIASVLFAAIATLIIYSPLGKISGGHINPAITITFTGLGKLSLFGAAAYVASQFTGAIAGTAVAQIAWGRRLDDINAGSTRPEYGGVWFALAAEMLATSLMLWVIVSFVKRGRLAPYTPVAAGIVIAIVAFFSAPFYGASMNPARSLGPAIIGGVWGGLWVYFVAPSIAALVVVSLNRYRIIPCAKLIHDPAYSCPFKNCLISQKARAGDVSV
ncbi:MIP/aquaporin family protein [[Kitasatospora] papulosa]|uniref:MIP/aquaporin family protein n=1 Tax=[Kitasatospora] papulosa TaxID=1464011 RepID=UPI003677ECC9